MSSIIDDKLKELLKQDKVISLLNELESSECIDKCYYDLKEIIFHLDDLKLAVYSKFMELLTSIKPDLLDYFSKIPAFLFYKCKWLTGVDIPKHINSIETCSFKETSLKEIIIPENIRYIHTSAFGGCDKLTSVKILGYTQLQAGIFDFCTNLDHVELNFNTQLGGNIFSTCPKLKEIIFNGTKNQFELDKEPFWNSYIETIHCIDGDIEI